MSGSPRERRIANELRILGEFAAQNPECLDFDGRLHIAVRTPGLCCNDGQIAVALDHSCRIEFPRFYPAVPLELYLAAPAFHPNIEPRSGFICLWDRVNPGQSAMEAVVRLQRILAWELFEKSPHHVMQPDALVWYASDYREVKLPLDYSPLREPEALSRELAWRIRRGGARRVRLEPQGGSARKTSEA